jgi:type IV pilus assembly protein PilW
MSDVRSPVGTPAAQRGFSLVELMIATAIALVLTIAIAGMLIHHEAEKRTLSSTNDLSLNSGHLSIAIDRSVRSAGIGIAHGWRDNFGCLLRAARGGTQILPRTTAFPAPFESVPQQVRVVPFLVHAGAGTGGSDVLMVAGGASGLGEVAMRVQPGSAATDRLRLPTTVGLRGGDLVLVAEQGRGCMIQQVASPFTGGATQDLVFGGTYAQSVIDSVALAGFASTNLASVSVLGSGSGNRPAFQLIGIGAAETLFAHDLLRLDGGDTSVPIADGVVDLRARYGVDSDGDGRVDSWVVPGAAGFSAAALSDGSAAAATRLMTIMTVRIGLVMRTDHIEREEVSQSSVTLFADLPPAAQVTRTLTTDERRLRFRTVEFTVPLRNVMMLARAAIPGS